MLVLVIVRIRANQRKIQGTQLGGLTLGVEPVTDGSANSLITKPDKTLNTIHEVGFELYRDSNYHISAPLLKFLNSLFSLLSTFTGKYRGD